MGWLSKSREERVVQENLGGLPQMNRLDDLRLMAEELRRAYGMVIKARQGLRNARRSLFLLQETIGAPAADLTAAEASLRDAENILRQKEAILCSTEERAKIKFPNQFNFI